MLLGVAVLFVASVALGTVVTLEGLPPSQTPPRPGPAGTGGGQRWFRGGSALAFPSGHFIFKGRSNWRGCLRF